MTTAFDYENQAWIVDGRYVRCGHKDECGCYGKLHEGQTPAEAERAQAVAVGHNPDWCNSCPDATGYGAGGSCLACGKPTSDRGHDWLSDSLGWADHAFQGAS